MSKVEFEAMWQLYKDNKKKTGERNTLLLVDMMEANESFYMTKEIWNEFKEIFKDYSHFQYRANKSKQKQRDESWIFWKYFHKHINLEVLGVVLDDFTTGVTDKLIICVPQRTDLDEEFSTVVTSWQDFVAFAETDCVNAIPLDLSDTVRAKLEGIF